MSSRSEMGTTAVELVVASALVVMLLGLAMPVVVRTQVAANRIVARGRVHDDGRAALVEVVRRLRAARPPGVCADPPGAPLEACLVLGRRPATILQATPERVCFAAAPNASGTEDVLVAPELVCLGRDPASGSVTVTSTGPADADECGASGRAPTYTTPCWRYGRPMRSTLVGSSRDRRRPMLTYRAVDGATLPPPGPDVLDATTDDAVLATGCDGGSACAAAALAAVAVVSIELHLEGVAGAEAAGFDLRTDVAPRGSRFEREQTWAAA